MTDTVVTPEDEARAHNVVLALFELCEPTMRRRDSVLVKWQPVIAAALTAVRQEKRARDAEDILRPLASAMRKVLPPALFQEVIEHLDPLTPFIAVLRSVADEGGAP